MAIFAPKSPQYRSDERVARQIGVRYADLRPSQAENRAIGGIGNLLIIRADEMKQERDAAVVGDIYNRWREAERMALAEIGQKKGKDAVNLHLDYDLFFNKSQGAADEESENGTQQAEIKDMLSRKRQQSLDSLARYEAVEGQRYKAEQEAGVINNGVADSREAGFDDARFEEARAEVYDFLRNAHPGASKEKIEAFQRKAESQMMFANMQARIDIDAQRALPYLEKWRNELGEGYFTLKNSIKTKIESTTLDTAYKAFIGKYGTNYEGAISEINNPESELTKDLDYAQRSSLNSRFYGLFNQREAMESNSREVSDKLIADKDFETWIKYTTGALPMEPVEDDEDLESLARNRKISKETYLGIKNINKKGTEFNNPWIVGDLTRKIARGEDAKKDLEKALRDGDIKAETFISMSADSENKLAQEGYGLLQRSMQPQAADKWDPDKNRRFGDAVDLFNIGRRAEPDKLPVDIAREVLTSYQEDLRRTMRGLPKPTFLKGKDYNYDALKDAQKETARAYNSGELTKEEYTFQMRTIQDYMNILNDLENISESIQHKVDKRNAN